MCVELRSHLCASAKTLLMFPVHVGVLCLGFTSNFNPYSTLRNPEQGPARAQHGLYGQPGAAAAGQAHGGHNAQARQVAT